MCDTCSKLAPDLRGLVIVKESTAKPTYKWPRFASPRTKKPQSYEFAFPSQYPSAPVMRVRAAVKGPAAAMGPLGR